MGQVIRHETVTKQRAYPRFGSYETEAPVIRCGCGREVVCSGFTNTCDCGADYNFSGQHLAPRSQWGEETGETADDILDID
jgi:hypothetical protein